MHRSGITVSDELRAAFADPATGYLKIQIQDENFVITSKAAVSGNLENDFQIVQRVLDQRSPAYVLIRSGDQWILVYYLPEAAMVKEKMLYAASRAALKEGLSGASFSEDFFCSHQNECTLRDYNHSRKQDATHELMTADEIMKREAVADSHKSVSNVKLAAMGDIPINVSESVQTAVTSFGQNPSSAVYFSLDAATETLGGRFEAKATVDDIARALPPKDALFALFHFPHEVEGKQANATVFVYYCPDLAIPRTKMFYSSTKSMVIKVLEQLGVEITKNLEVSEQRELTAKAVFDELYPKDHSKKTFAKPKRQGKGKARMHAGAAKFTS